MFGAASAQHSVGDQTSNSRPTPLYSRRAGSWIQEMDPLSKKPTQVAEPLKPHRRMLGRPKAML